MNYQLTFLDDSRRVQDVWEANFETEHTAICWMWLAGGACALHDDWSMMELWCRRCCAGQVKECPRAPSGREDCYIAWVPASVLRQSGKSEQHRRARPLIRIVERDEFIATSHWAWFSTPDTQLVRRGQITSQGTGRKIRLTPGVSAG